MDRKMYCAIRNRIRWIARENGDSVNYFDLKITLVNGTVMIVPFGDCELLDDDFVEIRTGDDYCFVPVKNILTISC